MNTVLTIDDNDSIRRNVQDILSVEGFEVLTADNGSDGIAMANSHLPDLVLCDITMPGIDGYEVLRRLREEESTTTIPFVFLTALDTRDDIRKGMGIGGDDYLTKPFTVEELLTAVKSRLDRSAEYAAPFQTRAEALAKALPHELRTSLTVILGFSEILADREADIDDELRTEGIEAIRKSARKIGRMVENFLMFASLEEQTRDRSKIEPLSQVDLPEMVAGAVRDLCAATNRESDLQVLVTPGKSRLPKKAFLKMIHELLDNAVKYSEPGTPIRVECADTGKAIKLTVTDQGFGMTPRQIKDVSAFVQFDRDIREQQGSGLGLTIVKLLTDIYGGELLLQSVQGYGTSATITLPHSARAV
jgi:two-component system, sensor histidine kinase and response regulator